MYTKSDNASKENLYEHLSQLTIVQFKVFYTAFVHYLVNHKCFITKEDNFNLWCELNLLCHELDQGFPVQYDDRQAIKDFWHFHPYYFIDHLPLDLIAHLFAEHITDHIDILINFAKHLIEADTRAAYTYMNKALDMNESIDYLVSETETHIKFFY